MQNFLRMVGIFTMLFLCQTVYAQKKDSTWIGTISGNIRDSAYNFDLQSATLTLYKYSDTSLVSYSLADNNGVFNFKELPINVPFLLVASFVGYKSQFLKLEFSDKNKKIALPTINMERSDTSGLNEVIVKSVAPIRMNGDTLEFNADAFHLDKNAVVDDLLRSIPNVTVWGDGSITVNGKEISSLKVDGKPYMGGSSKLALQNIAKDAVDKVQVYQVGRSETNLMDSTTEINIKIKKNKKQSAYGKIGTGIGTDHRYQAEGNYSIINTKTQVGISAGANNINESPSSVDAQLRNGTFGGVNASPEYQSNFSGPGTNKYYGGGVMVQHDFQETPTADNTQRIQGNYFVNNNISDLSEKTNSLSLLGGDSSQLNISNAKNYTNRLGHTLHGTFTNQKPKNTFSVNLNGNISKTTTDNNSSSKVFNQTNIAVSENNINNNSVANSKNMGLELGFNHSKSGWTSDYSKRFPTNYRLNYTFNVDDNHSEQRQRTDFTSLLAPSQNRVIDRRYNNDASNMTHSLFGSWGDFIPWIFGRRNLFSNFRMELNNSLALNSNKQNNYIADWDSSSHIFKENTYLTNNSQYTTIDEQPGLELNRSFFKSSANRYSKSINIILNPKWQLLHQKNNSSHPFQNFSRMYRNFIPSMSISLSNYQFGAYSENLSFNYSESIDIPSITQLRPLVDSANITYLALGNPNLREAKRENFSINFSHYDQHNGRNAFNFSFNANLTRAKNAFTDSSFTDSLGRTRSYTINVNGNNIYSIGGNLNKSIKITKVHQLQFQLNVNNSFTKVPNIVNNIWNKSSSFNSSNSLNINYSYKGIWATNIKQDYNYYSSKQSGINNNKFSNKQLITSFSTSVIPISKWSIGTNINFNRALSAAAPATNFTIWNAYTSYRFLKGNNLECKFAAMDLLHQNRTFFNDGNNNVISQRWTNALQQYFMLSISYFPRKFGKKEKIEAVQD